MQRVTATFTMAVRGLLKGRINAALFIALWFFAFGQNYLQLTIKGANHGNTIAGVDENCYYAYAHSLALDGNLNFTNEYQHVVQVQAESLSRPFADLLQQNPRHPENTFPCGTGFVGAPVLLLMRLICFNASPFAPIFPLAYLMTNITLGIGAIFLTQRLMQHWFARSFALIGSWTTALAGPFVYYLIYDPAMAHMTSAFFVVAAIYCVQRWQDSTRRRVIWAALAGASVGISVCVRPYNLPLVLLPAIPLVRVAWLHHFRKATRPPRSLIRDTLIAYAAALLGFFPQMLAWHSQYGTWIANPQHHGFSLIPPYALHVLLARRHGLFIWAPAFLVSMAFVIWNAVRGNAPARMLTYVFCGAVFMYGSWQIYWLGVSFGMRGFVDYLPVFAYGFCAFFASLAPRLQTRTPIVAAEIAAMFILLNFHLITAYRAGAVTVDGPLYWLDTVSYGKLYKAQLARDVSLWRGAFTEPRVSLFH